MKFNANFDNSYARLPAHFHASVRPATVPRPFLLAWNDELAAELGLQALGEDTERLARIFAGNEIPEGAEPLALAYAGHQFAYFVPQLGDGRAVLLGEIIGRDGSRFDIQLKGSGQTPFSRQGDGKSSLGPVIREYLLSESMYRLGVPTTRALAAVQTGERVLREEALPGGVMTRVASSHIRIGTFEYFAARGDRDAVETLVDYAIDRHYPTARDEAEPRLAFFRSVVEAQARLVADWMAIGFIHGVMNTDNTSIAGETLDYGPCAFMDEFRFDKVFSSIDRAGRYAYGRQPAIAQWNLARLAECLLPQEGEQTAYEETLEKFAETYQQEYMDRMRRKLGLTTRAPGDESLIRDWLQCLEDAEHDYTLSFRRLAGRVDADDESVFGAFESRWRRRLAEQAQDAEMTKKVMDAANPLFIPRNHQVERAIRGAIDGDLTVFRELERTLRRPFETQADLAAYAEPPRPDERVRRTFCGT